MGKLKNELITNHSVVLPNGKRAVLGGKPLLNAIDETKQRILKRIRSNANVYKYKPDTINFNVVKKIIEEEI